MKILVDASVGVKWFIPEDYSVNALKILEDYISGNVELYALDIFRAQVVSILRKYFLEGYIDMNALTESCKVLQEMEINYIEMDWEILEDALSYSLENNISLYDAIYIIASKRLGASIVTADQHLIDSLKNKELEIIDLGSYT
ncbi:MAG: type II toxin-antitoxin system VapC family toxin [Thermoproteales archaeon]|nr:type II toxin-antitoxin system VapC family toxin [Thermoproteales archaeon]